MNNCFNNIYNSNQKWFIGNNVRDLLLANAEIQAQVGTDIYPLIAPENTTGDFIVYQRDKYAKSYAKGGVYEDECYIILVAISDNYDNAVALASKIDNALTGGHDLAGDVKVDIMLTDSSEAYDDGKYFETLIFSIK